MLNAKRPNRDKSCFVLYATAFFCRSPPHFVCMSCVHECLSACGMSQIYSAHLIVGVGGELAGRRLPRPPHTFIKHRPVVTSHTHTHTNRAKGGLWRGGGEQKGRQQRTEEQQQNVNTKTRLIVGWRDGTIGAIV